MNIENDVAEIIKALDRAKENVPKDWDYISQDESIQCQVMELEYNCKELSAHIGVSIDQFPSVERLEEDEVKLIVDKILETMAAYHYYADLPNGLPVRIAYTKLLGLWNEEVSSCPFGNFHFDFYDEDFSMDVEEEADATDQNS